MAIILSETDLAPLYADPASMDALLDGIEASLRAHSGGKAPAQVRFQTPLPDGKRQFRVMMAGVPSAGEGLRVNALFRGAKDAQLSLLFDEASGDLLAVIAGREMNVWRTGSPAGVAARYLAPPDAKSLGLIGSGRQAGGQLIAIRRALPALERVRVFSPTEENRKRFVAKMAAWLQIEVEAVSDPGAAVADADIVSVATNSRTPVLEAGWISPGALVNSITSGQLPAELVASARVIASWKEEVLEGTPPREPYASMIASGSWSGNKIVGELGDVILGNLPARERESEIVIFESVGMPAWDTATAAWAYRWAASRRVGTPFSLA